jgi:hypothetical protein
MLVHPSTGYTGSLTESGVTSKPCGNMADIGVSQTYIWCQQIVPYLCVSSGWAGLGLHDDYCLLYSPHALNCRMRMHFKVEENAWAKWHGHVTCVLMLCIDVGASWCHGTVCVQSMHYAAPVLGPRRKLWAAVPKGCHDGAAKGGAWCAVERDC